MEYAEQVFIERGINGTPLTMLEMMAERDDDQYNMFYEDVYFQETFDDAAENMDNIDEIIGDKDLNAESFFKRSIQNLESGHFPTSRPVNPFPDLKTYVPEEYYEPISEYDLQMKNFDPMGSYDELQKYYEHTGQKNKEPLWNYQRRTKQLRKGRLYKPM